MAKQVVKSSGSGKKVLWFAGAVALGVLGWLGYNWYKKKQSKPTDQQPTSSSDTFQQSDDKPTSSPSSSGSKPTSLATNPFTSQSDLKKFQEWVLNVKKDTTILGSSGADGIWGKNSANAWTKYGAEYKKGTSTTPTSTSGLDSDTIQVLVNTRQNGYKVAWGNKATETYIKSSKYPDFFNNWKDAVLRRLKEGGNTLFYWGGGYYDSYTGNKQVDGKLSGRGIKAGTNTYNYWKVKGDKGNQVPKDTSLGQVVTWRYEISDNMVWIKSSNGLWYKLQYIKLI